MKLLVPDKLQARDLLKGANSFRDIPVCEGALPPPFILEAGIAPSSSQWLMPRLFFDERSFQIVGAGGYKSEPNENRIEIGYNVAPACRGRGYATSAVGLLVQEAFASGQIGAVTAKTGKSNEASRRVLQKADFVLVGVGSEGGETFETWIREKRGKFASGL